MFLLLVLLILVAGRIKCQYTEEDLVLAHQISQDYYMEYYGIDVKIKDDKWTYFSPDDDLEKDVSSMLLFRSSGIFTSGVNVGKEYKLGDCIVYSTSGIFKTRML